MVLSSNNGSASGFTKKFKKTDLKRKKEEIARNSSENKEKQPDDIIIPPDNALVHPKDWYRALAPGTLVWIGAVLKEWVLPKPLAKASKYYHLSIVDFSPFEPMIQELTTVPCIVVPLPSPKKLVNMSTFDRLFLHSYKSTCANNQQKELDDSLAVSVTEFNGTQTSQPSSSTSIAEVNGTEAFEPTSSTLSSEDGDKQPLSEVMEPTNKRKKGNKGRTTSTRA
ncbi:hypothetical protein E1B28_011368 [Marasmius oreades]|uniref:Uncharacterized protein n=1 Tax=Marasmius oreades TaxID=181124 RepID=A0A9P7RVB1_9AGAR|nr:uncharacterized protein E1B28_011368 [Marasmius oreades]KAG7089713.1 hypothetical protein E1B28_011368 [Marasmius oreades]